MTTPKKTLEITVPRDLAMHGVSSISSFSGIGRFVIPKGSRILTNGKDIEISVDQIISGGGSIETFPDSQTAAANTAGRSGGTIKIHARTDRGILTVVARGENGGASTGTGLSGASGTDGAPGFNAICGYRDDDAACRMSQSEYEGWVHKCRSGSIVGIVCCRLLANFYCKLQLSDGEQGSEGLPGGQGDRGTNDGNSGNILIDIADPSAIDVTPISVAGSGGLGGPGGLGGQGGQGGRPGIQGVLQICTRTASMGPPGPPGFDGKTGPARAPGFKGAVCLKLGAKSSGDCSGF